MILMLDKIDKKYPKLREKILDPFAFNCNPNYITTLAILVGLFSGILFYLDLIVIASFLYLFNGFLDILDGRIAKKYKRRTSFGNFYDATLDKLSDMFVMVGISSFKTLEYISFLIMAVP